jgi:hypothetical protein
VDRYKDVLQTITKKISSNAYAGQDQTARDKRLKKTHEFLLAQAMEDSAKELIDNSLLKTILEDCCEFLTFIIDAT